MPSLTASDLKRTSVQHQGLSDQNACRLDVNALVVSLQSFSRFHLPGRLHVWRHHSRRQNVRSSNGSKI